jgi:ABC-type sugar transport system permease subunit
MVRTKPATPYLFVLPLIALLLLIYGYPLVKIFDFAFKRIRGFDGPYIAFENFQFLLNDRVFVESVRHNIVLLLAVIPLLIISLFVAILLYERLRGWRFYRTVAFLPYVIAIPIVGVVLKNMFQFNGLVNETLRAIGLEGLALDWIGDKNIAIYTVMTMVIWRESSFGIILFLSRLLALNEELVEAAQLDGANWWQRTRFILLPELKGIIEFYIVIGLITMTAAIFAYVYIVPGKGGPANGTMVLELYIYQWAFEKHLPGIGAATAVILFLITAVLMFLLFRFRRQAAAEELA